MEFQIIYFFVCLIMLDRIRIQCGEQIKINDGHAMPSKHDKRQSLGTRNKLFMDSFSSEVKSPSSPTDKSIPRKGLLASSNEKTAPTKTSSKNMTKKEKVKIPVNVAGQENTIQTVSSTSNKTFYVHETHVNSSSTSFSSNVPDSDFLTSTLGDYFKCQRCICRTSPDRVLSVNCTYKGMKHFPEYLPDKIYHLNVSHNRIHIVNQSAIAQMKDLQTLAMRKNRIQQIIVTTREISQLKELDLGHNKLEKLENDVFSFLPNLKNLSLQRNEIKYIHNWAFLSLTKLQFLDLSFNQITYLQRTAFYSLTLVRELYLYEAVSKKSFSFIFQQMLFDKLYNLEILSIQGNSNNFSHYPIDAISSIKSLKTLNIDIVNKPSFLGPQISTLNNLTTLEFGPYSHCYKRNIPANFFQYVPYITSLFFNHCLFHTLDHGAFLLLPRLVRVSIVDNHLYSLEQAFKDLIGLQNSSLRYLRFVQLGRKKNQPCFSLTKHNGRYLRHLPLFELDLSRNRIADVSLKFIHRIPSTLKKLILSRNILQLMGWSLWSKLYILQNLEELDVSRQNPKTMFTDREEVSCLNSDNLSDPLRSKPIDRLTSQRQDDIQTSETKPDDRPLEDQCLHKDQLVVQQNETEFDSQLLLPCKTITFPRLLTRVKADHYNYFGQLIFTTNVTNNNLTRLNVAHSLLKHWGSGRIPKHVQYLDLSNNFCQRLEPHFFVRDNSLIHISLSSNLLGTQFSVWKKVHLFANLNKTTYLDISLNFIFALPYSFLRGLSSLETLQMTDNRLYMLNISLSETPKLRMLDVRRNAISWISRQTRHDLDNLALRHNISLALFHNAISCSCEAIELIKWLATTKVHLQDIDYLNCVDKTGRWHSMADVPLLYAELQRRCIKKGGIIVAGICSVSFFFVTVVGYYIGKRYRWWFYVKYKKNIWIAKLYGFRPKSTIQSATEYRYDAYVCYLEEDRHMAIECANKLDRHSLFFPDRDILPGTSEISGMISGITNSYTFLILLTENLKEALRTDFKHNGTLEYTMNMALFDESTRNRSFLYVIDFSGSDDVQMPPYLNQVLRDHDRRFTFPVENASLYPEATNCVWESLSASINQQERG